MNVSGAHWTIHLSKVSIYYSTIAAKTKCRQFHRTAPYFDFNQSEFIPFHLCVLFHFYTLNRANINEFSVTVALGGRRMCVFVFLCFVWLDDSKQKPYDSLVFIILLTVFHVPSAIVRLDAVEKEWNILWLALSFAPVEQQAEWQEDVMCETE